MCVVSGGQTGVRTWFGVPDARVLEKSFAALQQEFSQGYDGMAMPLPESFIMCKWNWVQLETIVQVNIEEMKRVLRLPFCHFKMAFSRPSIIPAAVLI
jgi:hypothetical protein